MIVSPPQHTREMQIHIARDGKPMGPFSLEEINRQLAAGTLSLSDQAWYEGAAGWAPLSTVPGVNGGSTGAELPYPPRADATTPSVPAVMAPTVGGPVTAAPTETSPTQSTSKLITTGYILCALALVPGCFGFAFGMAALVVGVVNLTKGSVLHGVVQIVLGLVVGYTGLVLMPQILH